MTALLVLGAFVAAWQVNRQIRQAGEVHREQLASSSRPFLVIQELRLFRSRVRAVVGNVGVGPAISVSGRAWVFSVEGSGEGTLEEAQRGIDAAASEVVGESPHYEMSVTAIGVGKGESEWFRTTAARPFNIGSRAVFRYELDYEDVFENRYRTESMRADRVVSEEAASFSFA